MTQEKFAFETVLEKAGGVVPFDPPVATVAEMVRLSKQCQKILDRLRLGRATTDDLAKIAKKYTGRISNIRQAGHKITATRMDNDTGLWMYELVENGI